MTEHPFSSRKTLPILFFIFATLLAAGCSNPEGPAVISTAALGQLYAGTHDNTPTEYRLDSQPFSPTLPYLFDKGRIVVLPPDAVPPPPANSNNKESIYAFTAIDRFGRLYHFDTQGRWTMAEGATLPEPLPEGQWDAAWNERTGALELLVTAPWAGSRSVELLSWNAWRWNRVRLAKAPAAREGGARLFHAAENRWLLAGGRGAGGPLADAWTIEGAGWKPWIGATPASGATPPLDQLRLLIDGPAGSGPLLLTGAGGIWIWKGQSWKQAGDIKIENLSFAFYVPSLKEILFVWSRGRGQDQRLWLSVPQIENASAAAPENIAETGLVRVNDRDEGIWKGWGRLREKKDSMGQTVESLEPGFKNPGEPAILIGGLDRDKAIARGKIETLELPPDMATLRFAAAAWVPALEGVLVPSICGLGIQAGREAFFPPEAWDAGTTSATQPLITVDHRNARFWIFKQKSVEWLKAPYEIHPGIDYAHSYQTIDGARRCLAWTYPGPGLLRYDFHEFHDKKVQWINSPRLSLKNIPQLAPGPGEELTLCDPVVWGDPPEIIVVGWCGRMGQRVTFPKAPPGLSAEAWTEIPARGFMASTSALVPSQWKISPLPVPFCQGAQLVVAAGQNSLYLLGGKTYELNEYDHRKLYFSRSQNKLWHWDGDNWHVVTPGEDVLPPAKATSHVVFDPVTRQLLCLSPHALYGFDAVNWHCLWQRPKRGEHWPDDVALYVHPQSNLLLAAWFMPELELRIWKDKGWVPVRPDDLPEVQADAGPGGPLPDLSENLVPSTQPDAFISLDAAALNAMRMDAPRDRDRDRLIGAYWLNFRAANSGSIPYARQALASVAPTTATVAARREDGATSGSGARLINGNDGKVVKKNRTGEFLKRLENAE